MKPSALPPIDSILALDILRKLAEEGVRVVLTYSKKRGVYRIDLEGGLFGTDETWVEGHTFGDAVETALDIFRRSWAGQNFPNTQDRPRPPEGQEVRFRCVGPCWTGNCDCKSREGAWNPVDRPPLHDGCVCVVEPAQRPTL